MLTLRMTKSATGQHINPKLRKILLKTNKNNLQAMCEII